VNETIARPPERADRPGTVVLHGPRRDAVRGLVGSVLLGALSVVVATNGRREGWLIGALALVGATLSLLSLVARGSLSLSPNGLAVRAMRGGFACSWADIQGVEMVGTRHVGLRIRGLPHVRVLPETYGRSARELGRMLDWWRLGGAAELHARDP
jgi:hypothetical protein